MNKMKKSIVVFLPILLLNGCSQMNSDFDCPMRSGIRCESIDSINSRIDRGEIGHESVSAMSNGELHQSHNYKNSNKASPQSSLKGKPLRYGETVQRVWVAPFEDKQGNYHQESDIYTIAKSGSWIGSPLKELTEDGE